MEKINLVLPENYDYKPYYGARLTRAGELVALEVLRHHRLPPREPERFSTTVTVSSFADYIDHLVANELIIKDRAVCKYNDIDGRLLFSTDPTSYFNSTITAEMEMHPRLAEWGINDAGSTYSEQELLMLLKKSRSMFANRDEHAAVVKGLQMFKGKATVEIERSDDRKGNVKANYSKSTTVDVALSFTLSTPIFVGEEKSSMLIEILAEISDASVRFWLESADLQELQENLIATRIKQQVTRVKGAGCLCVQTTSTRNQ